jgi:hypothetical protein
MSEYIDYKNDYSFKENLITQFTNPKGKSIMTTTTNAQNEVRNVILKGVSLHWAKLNPEKPVSPFGTDQWEITVQADKKRSKELEQFGKVKEGFDKGTVAINLKKKAQKKDGSAAAPVRVVDSSKQPIDPKIIGNGSVGNVMLMLKDYEIKAPNGKVTKSGTTVTLTAVQVTELVKYEPKNSNFIDFDDEGGTSTKVEDDEIPF